MKFMVELQLPPNTKNSALILFEERGPNRTPGLALRGAWVAARQDLVFALVEAADVETVAAAVNALELVETHKITPVLDIEQY